MIVVIMRDENLSDLAKIYSRLCQPPNHPVTCIDEIVRSIHNQNVGSLSPIFRWYRPSTCTKHNQSALCILRKPAFRADADASRKNYSGRDD